MNKEKIFDNMRGTVESIHDHIELEYSADAFAIWIFGTEDQVTTMVTKPEDMSFARDSVSAAIASNPVIKSLFSDGLKGLKNVHYDGDELVFDISETPIRSEVVKNMDSTLKKMFQIIEQGLNTKKMGPDVYGNVRMTAIANYCLPKFQKATKNTITTSIEIMSTVLEVSGCETDDSVEPELTEINFLNSIFKWRKN